VDKWNTTVVSSSDNAQNIFRTSAITSHATLVSDTERYSHTQSTGDPSRILLQSALHTAHPSGATTLARSRPCVRVEPQSCSVFGAQPLDLVPGGSSGLLSRHASVLSSHLPTGTDRFLPATTSTITQLTAGPEKLLIAFEQATTSSRLTSLLSKAHTPTMSASGRVEASQNALSVLLAALPGDVASSLEAGFSVVTQQLFATSEAISSAPTTRPTSLPSDGPIIISTSRSEPVPQSSRQSDRPTSIYTARPTTEQQPSHPTSRPTTQHTSPLVSRPTSRPISQMTESHKVYRPTTLATLPTPSTTETLSHSTSSSSTDLVPSSTIASSQPTITPERQQANGTIAGVATGAAAGAVLITLAIFFFLRRRQRNRSLKGVEEKASQPFPEVAWLYDPVRSPPRAQSPAPQNAEAAGILGASQAPSKRNSAHAPEVVMPEGEPLLAPGRAATRDSSPGGNGRDRSVSPGVALR
jgi:hypothetical protein